MLQSIGMRYTTLYKGNYKICEVTRLRHEKTRVDQRQNNFYRPSIHKYWVSKLAFSLRHNFYRNIVKGRQGISSELFDTM